MKTCAPPRARSDEVTVSVEGDAPRLFSLLLLPAVSVSASLPLERYPTAEAPREQPPRASSFGEWTGAHLGAHSPRGRPAPAALPRAAVRGASSRAASRPSRQPATPSGRPCAPSSTATEAARTRPWNVPVETGEPLELALDGARVRPGTFCGRASGGGRSGTHPALRIDRDGRGERRRRRRRPLPLGLLGEAPPP